MQGDHCAGCEPSMHGDPRPLMYMRRNPLPGFRPARACAQGAESQARVEKTRAQGRLSACAGLRSLVHDLARRARTHYSAGGPGCRHSCTSLFGSHPMPSASVRGTRHAAHRPVLPRTRDGCASPPGFHGSPPGFQGSPSKFQASRAGSAGVQGRLSQGGATQVPPGLAWCGYDRQQRNQDPVRGEPVEPRFWPIDRIIASLDAWPESATGNSPRTESS